MLVRRSIYPGNNSCYRYSALAGLALCSKVCVASDYSVTVSVQVTLMTDSGDTRDDLTLPKGTDDDEKLAE